MEIPATHYAASRAASVAENCINYQQGTPHKVFQVQTVQQACKEVSPGPQLGSVCSPTPQPRLRLPNSRSYRVPRTKPQTVCFHHQAENPCGQPRQTDFVRTKSPFPAVRRGLERRCSKQSGGCLLFLNLLAVLANRSSWPPDNSLNFQGNSSALYPKGDREKQAPCKRTKAVLAAARLWPPTSCLR